MMYRDYPERYSIVGDGLRAMPDGPRLAVLRDRSRTSRLRATRAIAIADLRDRLNRKARIQRSVAIAIIAFATGLAAVGLPFAVVEWAL